MILSYTFNLPISQLQPQQWWRHKFDHT